GEQLDHRAHFLMAGGAPLAGLPGPDADAQAGDEQDGDDGRDGDGDEDFEERHAPLVPARAAHFSGPSDRRVTSSTRRFRPQRTSTVTRASRTGAGVAGSISWGRSVGSAVTRRVQRNSPSVPSVDPSSRVSRVSSESFSAARSVASRWSPEARARR